jgi:hypothetical protein
VRDRAKRFQTVDELEREISKGRDEKSAKGATAGVP